MKLNLVIFLTSTKEQSENSRSEMLIKTFESTFRPAIGDIMDDPGFDSGFHNGYEVVKITINYEMDECYVSLQPLAIEIEDMHIDDYIDKLVENKWRIVSKEEFIINSPHPY